MAAWRHSHLTGIDDVPFDQHRRQDLHAPTQQERTIRLPFHAGSQTLTLATERVPHRVYALFRRPMHAEQRRCAGDMVSRTSLPVPGSTTGTYISARSPRYS